jgi:hypothetical protein
MIPGIERGDLLLTVNGIETFPLSGASLETCVVSYAMKLTNLSLGNFAGQEKRHASCFSTRPLDLWLPSSLGGVTAYCPNLCDRQRQNLRLPRHHLKQRRHRLLLLRHPPQNPLARPPVAHRRLRPRRLRKLQV